MDLLKDFDAINHNLQTVRLDAYDFDKYFLKLLFSYLSNIF